MLKELIQEIRGLAVKADASNTFTVANEPPHIYFIKDKDGQILRMTAERKPFQKNCFSLESLVAQAGERYITAVEFKQPVPRQQFWVAENGVTLLHNPDFGRTRDLSYFMIEHTDAMKWLAGVSGRLNKYSQKDFITMLRTLFPGQARELESYVAKIRFKKTQDGETSYTNTGASIGKQITQQVMGNGEAPLGVTLSFEAFRMTGSPVINQSFSFEIDLDNEKFALLASAEAYSKAIRVARFDLFNQIQRLHAGLTKEVHDKLDVFMGTATVGHVNRSEAEVEELESERLRLLEFYFANPSIYEGQA